MLARFKTFDSHQTKGNVPKSAQPQIKLSFSLWVKVEVVGRVDSNPAPSLALPPATPLGPPVSVEFNPAPSLASVEGLEGEAGVSNSGVNGGRGVEVGGGVAEGSGGKVGFGDKA
ncbi:MAG: hypothetical protein ACPLXP_03535 [Microgenomates group bacterium]